MNQKIQTPIQNFSFLEKNFKDFVNQEKKISKEWDDFFSGIYFEQDLSKDSLKKTNEKLLSRDEKINLIYPLLTRIYRKFGYLIANLNPLEESKTKQKLKAFMDLSLNKFNLSTEDLEVKIFDSSSKSLYDGKTLGEILSNLEGKYFGQMSAEFDHIVNSEKYQKLIYEFEREFQISEEEKKDVAFDLMETELFEKFIHQKFQGSKRFSIEGADSSLIFSNEFIKESNNLVSKILFLGWRIEGD